MSTIINPAPFQVELNSRKRSREDSQLSLESDEELDLLISGVPKRGHYVDLLEYSSSSPESGITDMSSPSANGDSLDAHPKSCSVQPFSVNQFPRANATQAAIGGLVPTSSAEPQQQVLNKGYQLRIVDQPEEVQHTIVVHNRSYTIIGLVCFCRTIALVTTVKVAVVQ